MTGTDPFVVILASAGSGKTYQLTHHLARQIYDELRRGGDGSVVERLLAATFTRKAAGEIIERVLKLLAKSVLIPAARTALAKEITADGRLDEDLCAAMLLAVVGRLQRMQISTLDAFVIRAARAFAPELGMDAPWTILDDAQDQALALDAIDAVLDEHATDDAARQRMIELLIRISDGKYPKQVRQRLRKYMQDSHAALLAGPSQAWEVIDAGPWQALDDDRLRQYVSGLANRLTPHLPLTKAGRPDKRWSGAVAALCEAAAAANWQKLLDGGLLQKLQASAPSYCGQAFPQAMVDTLRPLRDHCAATLLGQLRRRNLATRDLLQHYDRAYRASKARRAAWGFQDITTLLAEAGVAAPEKLDDFYFRLDGRLDHLLLDEFQDTSIAQWRMLQPLAAEIVSGGEGAQGAQRTFFLVGDVKQTLYGWRNAEPRLLRRLLDDWPQLRSRNLTESYRSAPVVIDTVNRIFQNLTSNPALTGDDGREYCAAAAQVWSGWFQTHTTHLTNQPGYCRLSACAAGDDAAALQQNALRLAAQRAAALRAARPDQEVAILVRRKKFIAPLAGLLQKLQIPAAGEGGNPLNDDAAVCAALSLLHLLDHPSDSAALYHVGTSPLGAALGLAPDATAADVLALTARVRTEILDRGLAPVLNRWLAPIAANCDARNFQRFTQLIELAYGFTHDGAQLGDFLDQARTRRFEQSADAPVRIMTIHGAKGRQFHHVILPDLDSAFLGGRTAGILLDRPDVLDPATCITHAPTGVLGSLDERLASLDQAHKSRQVIEEICALYVAITRAQIGVEMIVHPQGPGKNDQVNLPRSAAGVLRGVLAPGAAEPGTDLWIADGSVLPDVACPSAPPAPVAATSTPPDRMLSVAVVAPPAGESRHREVLSPSALEGGQQVNLADLLAPFDRAQALDRGTVLHRWFERILWLDDPALDLPALCRAPQEAPIDPSTLEELLPRFVAACRQPGVRDALSRAACAARLRPATDLQVWRERPFVVPMIVDGRPTLMRGQLDRVVIGRRDGRALAAEIVDYKSDRVSPGEAVRRRAEHYRPQMLAYRQAVATLLGLDLARVSANLLFVEADQLVTPSD